MRLTFVSPTLKTDSKETILNTEMARLKAELEEKDKFFNVERTIRQAVENASLSREKEFEQLRLEFQREENLLEQAQKAHKATEEKLLEKEKELRELNASYESLKEVLINKGAAKVLTSPEEKGQLWISGKSPEKRQFARLDLTKDYHRTIILRMEKGKQSANKKAFVNNISLGGLCFETKKELKEKEALNLRLFFFGGQIPMIKIKARIIWRQIASVNHCGVSFISLEEKDKTLLSRYVSQDR